MFDAQGRFLMENYLEKPAFSSFLPGIAGRDGVPVWCYYNNRGQAVCSFGVENKDHAILEFSAACVAYRDVSRTGFRTFCKVEGVPLELFTGVSDMHIGMSEVELTTKQSGLEASVCYFGVPHERIPCLARILTIRNITEKPVNLQVLDGLACIVPYGIDHNALKNVTQLATAWMQAEDVEQGQAYFRARASMADAAKVTQVEEGNFFLGWTEAGQQISPLVQAKRVFGNDSSLAVPQEFYRHELADLCAQPQISQNQYPCCFAPHERMLAPGEAVCLYSLYGQAESKAQVKALCQRIDGGAWFAQKREQAAALVEQLCCAVDTKTASPVFDAYCKQSYLDNLLRGGAPMFFQYEGKQKPYYIYSRKHGDPEREYNYFSLGREYYAQGNANFRDVNQNRRCDVMFVPQLGAENIHTFYDLIQTDGYNPLVVNAVTYTLDKTAQEQFSKRWPSLRDLLSAPFTPGTLCMALEDAGVPREELAQCTAEIVCYADSEPNADFSEGYWCDHWTYNLDLVENYLAVYPDRKHQLLFEDRSYRYYETRVKINPRAKRYELTPQGLRQYHALDSMAKQGMLPKWMHTADGQMAVSTLAEKMILMCALKASTLDAAGMGVEMEGGRPGWYDALNGLPGLLGSSMPESCETVRMLHFVRTALEEQKGEIELYEEVEQLLYGVGQIMREEKELFTRWDRLNTLREEYRSATMWGYSGKRIRIFCTSAAELLASMEMALLDGIERAAAIGGGLLPTYFSFSADGICQTEEGPMPTGLTPHPLPLFLEGVTRYMKLELGQSRKEALAEQVKNSELYDAALCMYRVNASLAQESFEVGRAQIFTPGWLENGSIWLHMEYKYFLELLKSGLYERFGKAFRDGAVPFLNPARYGRSTLENVSFIASSANPDPELQGRGFVARLSGSTVEFLHIWQIMFFGLSPFKECEGQMSLSFTPFIPNYLMPDDGVVHTTFLGKTAVIYKGTGLDALQPGKTRPVRYHIVWQNGSNEVVEGDSLPHSQALAVRDGKAACIQVEFAACQE